jgi:hypothetical protein
MGRFRRQWRITLVCMTVICSLAVGATPANAFKLFAHEAILRLALPPLGMPNNVVFTILGDLPSGTGNLGSDLHQSDAFRHFDNAKNPIDICARATAAWSRFYGEIRTNVQPGAPPYFEVQGLEKARQSFGALTHALQDFYAHSNWIEIFIDQNLSPSLATSLFPNCNAAALPAGLQTGFYAFELANWGGCPPTGAPAGFKYCHENLNKDQGSSLEGRKTVPGTSTTYYSVAAQLALSHTTRLYHDVVASLRQDWAAAFPTVRSDCLNAHLFQDSKEFCRFGQLSIATSTSGVALGAGDVKILAPSGQELATYSVSSWPPPPIQTTLCLPGTRARWDFTVNDVYPLPTPRRISGETPLVSNSPLTPCDASLSIDARANVDYLVRFTSTDTKLFVYDNVIAIINDASRSVPGGPVVSGGTIWLDLGPCPGVQNYDFVIRFTEPGTNIPKTAYPDPPPLPALVACQDAIRFGDLGGSLYP